MESGDRLSHYRLVEKIGEGGMGVVWKAEDTILGRTVAIKVLAPDFARDDERRRMFLDEARLASSLSHAHIAQVHELGREGDLDFIVMEYVEGKPLSRILHGRPLPPDKVASLGLQVALAVSRAHRKGLLHRDLKPANILVTPDGDAKVVDFGLATLFERRDSTLASELGTGTMTESLHRDGDKNRVADRPGIAGTLPYMSPEQVRGEALDARSDIFSFGTVLYEMTTGQRPFPGVTPAEVASAIIAGRPRPVHEIVPKVPIELDRIIGKALAPHSADRYQDPEDLAVDLRHLGKELEAGSSRSWEEPRVAPKPSGSRRGGVAVAAVAILLIAAAGSVVRARSERARRNRVATATAAHSPNWLLVAEFDAPGNLQELARAAREIVAANLEQSDVVTPIPRADMKQGLEQAMKPDTTRIAGEVARELAARAGARTYLEGRVDAVLRGYSVIVRVIDTESGRSIVSETALVENKERFLGDLAELSRRLRTDVGEKADLVRATRESNPAMTLSFEAFQWWLRSYDDGMRGDYPSAIHAAERAVSIDPGFARAWISLGVDFFAAGMRDSAFYAYDRALEHRDRLLEYQRLRLQGIYAYRVNRDPKTMLEYVDLALKLRPFDSALQNDRGVALQGLGREREEAEAYSLSCSLAVFGNPVAASNLLPQLISNGQYGRAARLVAGVPGSRGLLMRTALAVALDRWAAVDSLVEEGARAGELSLIKGAVLCTRGQVTLAAQALNQLAVTEHNADVAQHAALSRRLLGVAGAAPSDDVLPSAHADTSSESRAMLALLSAMYGDREETLRQLRGLESKRSEDPQIDVDIRLAEAWLALRDGHCQDVVQILEGWENKPPNPQAGALPLRWVLASARERLGNLKEAARLYDLVLRPWHLDTSDFWIRPAFAPFAHQRLVVIYAHQGEIEKAREHWRALNEPLRDPDPPFQRLLEEARQALAAAEAKL